MNTPDQYGDPSGENPPDKIPLKEDKPLLGDNPMEAPPADGDGLGLKLKMPVGEPAKSGQASDYMDAYREQGSANDLSDSFQTDPDDDLAAIMPRGGLDLRSDDSIGGAGVNMVATDKNPMGGPQDIYGRTDQAAMSRLHQHEPAKQGNSGLVLLLTLLLLVGAGGGFVYQQGMLDELLGGGAEAEAIIADQAKQQEDWEKTRDVVEDLPYYLLQFESLENRKPRVSELVTAGIATDDQITDAWGRQLIYDAVNDEVVSKGQDGSRYTSDDFVYDIGRERFSSIPSKPFEEKEEEFQF
jgi:hypothetical protein